MAFLSSLFGKPDPDQFSRSVMEALKASGYTDPVQYDKAGFRLVLPERGLVNLGKAYQEYAAAPAGARARVVRNCARFILSSVKDEELGWSAARPKLLPTVRGRSYYEAVRLSVQLQGLPPDSLPKPRLLTQQLAYDLVMDFDDRVQTVGPADLQRWGVSFEDAMKPAMENLRRRSNPELIPCGNGLYRSPWQDSHDPARLLLPEVIRRVRVNGDPVAAVPNGGTLLVTGSNNQRGLEQMAREIGNALQKPRAMSGMALRWKDGRWSTFLPPADSPAFAPMKRAALISLAQDYAGQQGILRQVFEARQQETWVATFNLIEHPERGFLSYAVWTYGCKEMLLPWADEVCFVQVDAAGQSTVLGRVPWEQVKTTVPDLIEETDHYPDRFLVRGFPNTAPLAAMGVKPPA